MKKQCLNCIHSRIVILNYVNYRFFFKTWFRMRKIFSGRCMAQIIKNYKRE